MRNTDGKKKHLAPSQLSPTVEMKKLMKSESVRKSEGKKATASPKEERKKLKNMEKKTCEKSERISK